MDINDFKNNTAGGVHSACLGGCWMTVVNGFAGLRDYPQGLELNPVLPKAWSRYSFPLAYKGSRIRVTVDKNGAAYQLLSGAPVTLRANGKEVCVR
jgi:alpha,alpha-trehalose phosphorylase